MIANLSQMSIISIFGKMDSIMVASVKKALQNIPRGSIVKIRINSHGGNMEALRKISGFLYFLQKYNDCEIHGEMIYAESAALDLFLNTKKRFVAKKSIGVIHLPTSTVSSEYALQKKTIASIRFIERRTKMTRSQIINHENFHLTATEMILFGIAHEIVPTFIAEPSL